MYILSDSELHYTRFREPSIRMMPGEKFAILYERAAAPGEFPTLHCHGRYDAVLAKYQEMWARFMKGEATPEGLRVLEDIRALILDVRIPGPDEMKREARSTAGRLELWSIDVAHIDQFVIDQINAATGITGGVEAALTRIGHYLDAGNAASASAANDGDVEEADASDDENDSPEP